MLLRLELVWWISFARVMVKDRPWQTLAGCDCLTDPAPAQVHPAKLTGD